jgi:hypothetical protein
MTWFLAGDDIACLTAGGDHGWKFAGNFSVNSQVSEIYSDKVGSGE